MSKFDIIKAKRELNSCILSYINEFCKKHVIDFEGWVADSGEIACFSDGSFLSFTDIRYDLETDQTPGFIFQWYWESVENAYKKKAYVNFISYSKGIRV